MLAEIARLEDYIKAELNIKRIEYTTDEDEFITLYAKPNSAALGKRLGKSFKAFKLLIEQLDSESINQFLQTGQLALENEVFSGEDILVYREAKTGYDVLTNRFVSIELNCKLDSALIAEGLAREVVNRIQKTRKEQGFQVADRIEIGLFATPELMCAINQHKDYIMQETLALSLSETGAPQLRFDIDEHQLGLSLALAR